MPLTFCGGCCYNDHMPRSSIVEDALLRMEADGLLTRPTRRGGLTPFEPIKLRSGVRASDLISRERDEGF